MTHDLEMLDETIAAESPAAPEIKQKKVRAKRKATRKAPRKPKAAPKLEQPPPILQQQPEPPRDDPAAAERERQIVAERQKLALDLRRIHEADLSFQQDAHRAETARLRDAHRQELSSHQQREAEAIVRHYGKLDRIDTAEKAACDELDARRRSFAGRIAGLLKGARHYERQRQTIKDRHERQRGHYRFDLEILIEQSAIAMRGRRLRHINERKAIFDRHRAERRFLQNHPSETPAFEGRKDHERHE
jgi:hypothetical protein